VPDPLLVALVGPTGSGKTALSLHLAERFQGEIVNCDSVALHRGFVIGAAKPTEEERARAPHHLLDIVEPSEHCTAGEYARRARRVLAEIRGRGRLPIVVGGTGLYLRALLEGLSPGPPRSEELRARLRARAVKRGSAWLHRMLQRLDKAAAARIHPNDQSKLIRALEVCFSARRPLSGVWAEGREPLPGFRVLRLGLDPPRSALYERLDQRAEQMFARGLIEETKALLAEYGPAAWPLSAPGYRQAALLLSGELDSAQALAATRQAHRNYAKRQMTWFRREPEVVWIQRFGDDPAAQAEAAREVEERFRQG
jgi:tRNA dimethylallyltransferase